MTYEIDGTSELLECIDILMARLVYFTETAEWLEMADALDEAHYSGDLNRGDHIAAGEILAELYPTPDFTEEQLETALWQTADLALTLLTDHMWALDEVEALHLALEAAHSKAPSLYGPDGQALA